MGSVCTKPNISADSESNPKSNVPETEPHLSISIPDVSVELCHENDETVYKRDACFDNAVLETVEEEKPVSDELHSNDLINFDEMVDIHANVDECSEPIDEDKLQNVEENDAIKNNKKDFTELGYNKELSKGENILDETDRCGRQQCSTNEYRFEVTTECGTNLEEQEEPNVVEIIEDMNYQEIDKHEDLKEGLNAESVEGESTNLEFLGRMQIGADIESNDQTNTGFKGKDNNLKDHNDGNMEEDSEASRHTPNQDKDIFPDEGEGKEEVLQNECHDGNISDDESSYEGGDYSAIKSIYTISFEEETTDGIVEEQFTSSECKSKNE